jgi:hypothetical protein
MIEGVLVKPMPTTFTAVAGMAETPSGTPAKLGELAVVAEEARSRPVGTCVLVRRCGRSGRGPT